MVLTFGQRIRFLREAKGLLLREVSDALSLDIALLSKFERDERLPTRRQVLALSKYYGFRNKELLVSWLSDKILDDVKNEPVALLAVKEAEKKVRQYIVNDKNEQAFKSKN